MQVEVIPLFDFGETLRNLRKKNKLTQQQLAKKLDVSESLISRYESNEVQPPFDTLRTLAAILNVSMDELCGTEQRETISTHGLSQEQTGIIKALVSRFRTMNNEGEVNLTGNKLSLLGYLVTELVEYFNNK